MNARKLLEIISQTKVYKRSSHWDAAFVLYNQNHDIKKRPGCGSCYKDVRTWLEEYVN